MASKCLGVNGRKCHVLLIPGIDNKLKYLHDPCMLSDSNVHQLPIPFTWMLLQQCTTQFRISEKMKTLDEKVMLDNFYIISYLFQFQWVVFCKFPYFVCAHDILFTSLYSSASSNPTSSWNFYINCVMDSRREYCLFGTIFYSYKKSKQEKIIGHSTKEEKNVFQVKQLMNEKLVPNKRYSLLMSYAISICRQRFLGKYKNYANTPYAHKNAAKPRIELVS